MDPLDLETNGTMLNDTYFYYDFQPLVTFFSYSILFTACIGVPANLFVLGCSINFILTQVGKLAPLIYHYFILSITAADLIFLIFFVCTLVAQDRFDLDFASDAPVFCKCRVLLTHLATVASSTSLLCLNMDKFVAIVRPLHHASLMTKRLAVAAISGCWIIAVCWTMLFTFGPWTEFYDGCRVNVARDAYMIFSILFFIGPVSVAAILSSTIAIVASKAIHRGGSVKFGTGKGQRCSNTGKGLSKLAFVFSTTFWSCISCLPYRIYYIILQSEGVLGDRFQRRPEQEILIICFYALMISYPAGNAIVTLATQRRYRAILAHLIKACAGKKKTDESELCSMRRRDHLARNSCASRNNSIYSRNNSLAVFTVPEE